MGRNGPPPPRIGGRNGRLPNPAGAEEASSPLEAGVFSAPPRGAPGEAGEPPPAAVAGLVAGAALPSGAFAATGAAEEAEGVFCTVWPEELSAEGEASPEPVEPDPENAGTVVTGSNPNRFRIALATSSSSELECVFRALSTPTSGSRSIILPGFTSSSRANSLIRIFITQRVSRLLYLS